MRCGLGNIPDCLSAKFGDVSPYVKRLMSDKLTPKSDKCFFVVCPRETKGYYFYNPAEGKVFVVSNGLFLEKEFLSKGVSGIKVQLEEIRDVPEMVSAPTELSQKEQEVVEPVVEEPAPWRSVRARRTPEKFTLLTTGQRDVLLLDNDEPKTYTKAIMVPDSEKWLGAMKSEIESMHDNQVWNLVDPIDGVRPMECKWIFKKK